MTQILQKGANLQLPEGAAHSGGFRVLLSWRKRFADDREIEVDASAFLLAAQDKVRSDADFIFYNQPEAIEKSVRLKQNEFVLALNRLPEEIKKVSFVLSIHDAKSRRQDFGLLKEVVLDLIDASNQVKLLSFRVEDLQRESAVILGQVYRYQDQWKFKAIGQGFVDGLASLARNYGVEIVENAEQAEDHAGTESTQGARLANQASRPQSGPDRVAPRSPLREPESAFDIQNTDLMTRPEFYLPIQDWLSKRNIRAQIDPAAVDTRASFGEIAIFLGDRYDALRTVIPIIQRAMQSGRDRATIDLSSYSARDAAIVNRFLKLLNDSSLVSKCILQVQDKKAILHLPNARRIVRFFQGEWLEWYAFMKIALLCRHKQMRFSCARNILIELPNKSNYELDVFFLIDELPLVVECKAGDYRQFIGKYSNLINKLGIDSKRFIFLIVGADETRLKGLSVAHPMVFANEKTLMTTVKNVLIKGP